MSVSDEYSAKVTTINSIALSIVGPDITRTAVAAGMLLKEAIHQIGQVTNGMMAGRTSEEGNHHIRRYRVTLQDLAVATIALDDARARRA